MKLFEAKSKLAEQSADEELEPGRNERPKDSTENEEAVVKEKKPLKLGSLKAALLRCAAALLLAGAVLAVSGFSIIDLTRGAAEAELIHHEETGSFVKREIFAILGSYDAEPSKYTYSVVPMGDKLVTVQFTGRYKDSADAIMEQTGKYTNGLVRMLDQYVTVQGTVGELDEEQSGKMYEWFAANKAEMVKKGVLLDTGDDADYLSDKVLLVDAVNGKSQTLVLILTGIAALFVLYIIAELVLMAMGLYKAKPKDKADEDANFLSDGKAEPENEGKAGSPDESKADSTGENKAESEDEK